MIATIEPSNHCTWRQLQRH